MPVHPRLSAACLPNLTRCEPCEPGTYADGAVNCQNCTVRRWWSRSLSSPFSHHALSVQVGKYTNTSGTAACAVCPRPFTTVAAGATSCGEGGTIGPRHPFCPSPLPQTRATVTPRSHPFRPSPLPQTHVILSTIAPRSLAILKSGARASRRSRAPAAASALTGPSAVSLARPSASSSSRKATGA